MLTILVRVQLAQCLKIVFNLIKKSYGKVATDTTRLWAIDFHSSVWMIEFELHSYE